MNEPAETFAEKVILLLIDKVAIGALIGLAAFCASVVIERLKAALLFRSEVNKIRVQKMAELWQIFAGIHTQLSVAVVGRARIVKEEFDRLDDDTKFRVVAARGIADNARSRIISEIKPSVEQSLQKLLAAWPLLEGARFWLGKRLYDMHVEHLQTLTRLSDNLVQGLLSNEATDVVDRAATNLKAAFTRLDVKQVEKVL